MPLAAPPAPERRIFEQTLYAASPFGTLATTLLIFALLILPAATAQQLTARPAHAIGYAVLIGVVCVWLGLLIGFYLPYPPSFFITTLTFLSYLATRPLGPGRVARGRALATSGLLAASTRDAVRL